LGPKEIVYLTLFGRPTNLPFSHFPSSCLTCTYERYSFFYCVCVYVYVSMGVYVLEMWGVFCTSTRVPAARQARSVGTGNLALSDSSPPNMTSYFKSLFLGPQMVAEHHSPVSRSTCTKDSNTSRDQNHSRTQRREGGTRDITDRQRRRMSERDRQKTQRNICGRQTDSQTDATPQG
jgi:hypothetical protein